MTKWKCKSNGVIIELEDRETKQMLQHEGYELVIDMPKNKTKKKED